MACRHGTTSRETGADAGHKFGLKNGSYIHMAGGATVPTDGAAGYEKGCIWLDTDATGADIFYINTGTVSSCAFKKLSYSDVATTGRISTTDNVASGTARVVGGMASVQQAAGTSVTNTTTETKSSQVTLPANTIKAGTVIRIRGQIRVTTNNSTVTCTARLRFGADGTTPANNTALIASTAVDTGVDSIIPFEFTLVGRAAPGAAAAVIGLGTFSQPAAVGGAVLTAALPVTNFATNAALYIQPTIQWSAADANAANCEILNVEMIG